jgi:hypothetical protein
VVIKKRKHKIKKQFDYTMYNVSKRVLLDFASFFRLVVHLVHISLNLFTSYLLNRTDNMVSL